MDHAGDLLRPGNHPQSLSTYDPFQQDGEAYSQRLTNESKRLFSDKHTRLEVYEEKDDKGIISSLLLNYPKLFNHDVVAGKQYHDIIDSADSLNAYLKEVWFLVCPLHCELNHSTKLLLERGKTKIADFVSFRGPGMGNIRLMDILPVAISIGGTPWTPSRSLKRWFEDCSITSRFSLGFWTCCSSSEAKVDVRTVAGQPSRILVASTSIAGVCISVQLL